MKLTAICLGAMALLGESLASAAEGGAPEHYAGAAEGGAPEHYAGLWWGRSAAMRKKLAQKKKREQKRRLHRVRGFRKAVAGIEGSYSVQGYDGVTVEFGEDQTVVLKGCNTNSGTYSSDSAHPLNLKMLFATERACLVDKDQTLIDVISSGRQIEVDDDEITLFDKNGDELLVLLKNAEVFGKYFVAGYGDMVLDCKGDRTAVLEGCNRNEGSYVSDGETPLKLDMPMATRKTCDANHDREVIDKINEVTKIEKDGPYVKLSNEGGDETITLVKYEGGLELHNQYSVKGEDVTINFGDNNAASLKGCNVNSGTFESNSQRPLKLDLPLATLRACEGDKDREIIEKINSATKAEVEGAEVRLFDKDGGLVATLAKDSDSLELEGEYAIEEFAGMTVTFAAGNIASLKGCNVNNGSFDVNSGAPLKLDLPIATRRACLADHDREAIETINAATRAEVAGSQITLFNSDGSQAITLARKAK